MHRFLALSVLAVLVSLPAARAEEWSEQLEHKYADSDGVKIHSYAMPDMPRIQAPVLQFHGLDNIQEKTDSAN